MYTAARTQTTLTPRSEIVEESDFSDAAYNFAYIRDVQSFGAKCTSQQFFGIKILTQYRHAW